MDMKKSIKKHEDTVHDVVSVETILEETQLDEEVAILEDSRPENYELIQEGYRNKENSLVEFKDGNKLNLSPEQSKMIYSTYNQLSESNQKEMKKLLNESLDSFTKVIFFVYKNAREK